MQVTGCTKLWFPFHLIQNHFICWNSTSLLTSISRLNWFRRCAHIRLFYILLVRLGNRMLRERSNWKKFYYVIYFVGVAPGNQLKCRYAHNQINALIMITVMYGNVISVAVTNIAKMTNYICAYTRQQHTGHNFETRYCGNEYELFQRIHNVKNVSV